MNTRLAMTSLLVIFCFFAQAQIVNTERLRMWIGERNFAVNSGMRFSYTNNDGNYVFSIKANAGALYKFRDKNGELNNKLFLNGNYGLVRAKEQDFSNNWFVHLRFNKEFSSFFRVETFIQSQENQILSISSRNLIGAGVRLKPLEEMAGKRLHLYIGLAYMYEEEKSDAFNLELFNHRASSYLTTILDFGNRKPKIYNTIYFQPLLEDVDNYRLSEEFTVEFPITGNLGINGNFNYFRNNRTPAGDAEYSSNVTFGFVYNFQSEIPNKGSEIDAESIEKNRPDN